MKSLILLSVALISKSLGVELRTESSTFQPADLVAYFARFTGVWVGGGVQIINSLGTSISDS